MIDVGGGKSEECEGKVRGRNSVECEGCMVVIQLTHILT